MAKSKITINLEQAIFKATKKIGVFSGYEVTIGFNGNERVDFLTLDTKGTWRCYEIKSSVSDFRSKAKISFVGHYNYYVLTQELYDIVKDEIPKEIGVYIYHRCIKKAKKQALSVADDILKISFIRSLSRDAAKYHESNNPKIIEQYDREINRLRKENYLNKESYRNLEKEIVQKFGRRWHER